MHPHRAQIARRYYADQSSQGHVLRVLLALRLESPTSIAAEWKHIRHARSFDARNGIDVPQHLAKNSPAARRVVSVVVIYLDHRSAAGLESQIHIQSPEKATQQQTRAHQQYACERHLRNH